jgi:hypothetical protein
MTNYKLGTDAEYSVDDNAEKVLSGWLPEEVVNGKEVDGSLIETIIRRWSNPDGTDEHLWPHDGGSLGENDKYNILCVWRRSIIKPDFPKYYIASTGDTHAFGVVDQDHCMATGLERLEIFDSEADYEARATELGIDLEVIE